LTSLYAIEKVPDDGHEKAVEANGDKASDIAGEVDPPGSKDIPQQHSDIKFAENFPAVIF